MKRIAILIVAMLFTLQYSSAQSNNEGSDKLSVYTSYQQAGNFGASSLLGNLSLKIKPWFSLHYTLGFGVTNRNRLYIHTPATAGLGAFLLFTSLFSHSGGWLTVVGLLVFIAPEGISFHIRPTPKLMLSPYLNVNSTDFFHRKGEFNVALSLESGLRADYDLGDRMFLSSFAGAKLIETKGLGFHLGIGLGWKL